MLPISFTLNFSKVLSDISKLHTFSSSKEGDVTCGKIGKRESFQAPTGIVPFRKMLSPILMMATAPGFNSTHQLQF